MTQIDYDILVVGAGPAGLATAIAATRNGARVLLVERHPGTSTQPRATGVSTRSTELFRSWGVLEEIRAGSVRALPLMSVGPTLRERHAAVPFGYPTSARDVLAVSPAVPICCPQDHIEPVLLAHLRDLGAEVRFRTELAQLSTDADGITAELADLVTGATAQVRARYVVGADGPRSAVRTVLGVEWHELGRLGEYVNILFYADLTPVLGDQRYVLYVVEHPEAGGVILPAGDGRWMYGKQWHREQGESAADFTPEHCVALIRAAAGVPDLDVRGVAVQPFTMVGRLAATWRVGRAFLAGDAAHQMTPVGGVGMNTALHDGHNLGWKLAWVVRGWADEGLLDSYEAERRPVGERNTRQSLRLTDTPDADTDVLSADLGATYRSAVIADESGAGGAAPAPFTGHPGQRAPHAWVGHGGRRRSTLDLFDGQLTLLVGRRGRSWQQAAAAVAGGVAAGVPMSTFTLGWELADPRGTAADRYGIGEEGAALVRPDGYVAWRSSGAVAQPAAALGAAVATALGAAPAAAPLAAVARSA